MLHIDTIDKSYRDGDTRQDILNQLSLTIDEGQSISIRGASGSGKSTLLHLLAALDKPDKGHIWLTPNSPTQPNIDITRFTEAQADAYRMSIIGMVFQKYNLIDVITVNENVYLPAKLNAKNNSHIDSSYINQLMQALGISKHTHKLPNQLSGGEQQRVAIARALSHKPRLLLADEPTGNLDSRNSDLVSRLLIDTCKALNTTLILVTHSEEVAALTQRQVFLEQGRLVTGVA